MLVSLGSWVSRHWLLGLVLTMAAGLVVPAVMGGLSAFGRIPGLGAHWLLLLLGVMFLAVNLNVLRFRLLLRHHSVGLSHPRALVAILAVAFTVHATPGGVGAPVAALAVLRRYQVPPSVGVVVYSVTALVDLAVLCALLAFSVVWWLGETAGLVEHWQLAGPVLVLVVGVLAMVAVFRYHRRLAALVGRSLAKLGVSTGRRYRLARHLVRFRRALREVTSLSAGELVVLTGLCVVLGLLRYSVLFLAVLALGGGITWMEGFLIQFLAQRAARLVVLPGGLGTAEAAGVALLSPALGAPVAATAVLVWRFFTFHLYLIVGGPALLHLAGAAAFRRAG